MKKGPALALPLLLAAAVSRAADFQTLYSLPLPRPGDAALADLSRHAVPYQLRGAVVVHEDRVVLNTEDGRVFVLDLPREQAEAFDDKLVEVWGKAEASDDLDSIKVTSISEYTPDPAAPAPPPYKSKFRRAVLEGEEGGALKVSNLRWLAPAAASHDPEWVSAVIKPELLKDIYFVTKVQPPGIAGHSLLFYEFEEGGFLDASGRSSRGFFLSVEAYAREGQDYSLLAGFKKTYGIVWLLTNFEDYVLKSAAFSEDWLNFYPLLAGRDGKVRMTRDTVAQATVNRDGEWYHSTRNNCTNNLVTMINHALPEKSRVRMWTIPNLLYSFYATTPPMVPGYLGRKGVLGPKAFTIDPGNVREFVPAAP